MSLWAEIKQRRITQIVVAYLAGGFVALEALDQVVDREVLPLVVYEVALALYLFGILAALVIGWFHGEKGEQKAPPLEIGMLVVIGALALFSSVRVVQSSMRGLELADAVAQGDLRSLAVLYLEDVSSDQSMQVTADGITEGLIRSLSTVRELDVLSRNASREARALGDVESDSVASFLGVGALVDGTIDRAGDELRISIRLVEGATGQPISRETYRWVADDLTAIVDSLAAEVAEELRAQLGVEIRLREGRDAAPNAAAWLQVARAERYLKDATDALERQDGDAAVAAFDAAGTELAAARGSAPEWVEPVVLRSRLAYERHVLAHDLDGFLASLDAAVAHADTALALDPDNAGALEWRGTARYRRYLAEVDPDDDREALLSSAQGDLTQARTLSSNPASVNSTLSHLLYQVDDWLGAVLAARNAYEQDAFLDVADEVLWRLVTTYYDLGEHDNSEDACLRGYGRFPQDFRFTQCQILVMTMPDATPDVDRAWELHAELLPKLTQRPELFDAQSRIMIGSILGRAGLADSAQAVFEAARVSSQIDPERELLSFEAGMRSVMGDVDGAIEALERYVVARPDHPPSDYWWWDNISDHADFRRLVQAR